MDCELVVVVVVAVEEVSGGGVTRSEGLGLALFCLFMCLDRPSLVYLPYFSQQVTSGQVLFLSCCSC